MNFIKSIFLFVLVVISLEHQVLSQNDTTLAPPVTTAAPPVTTAPPPVTTAPPPPVTTTLDPFDDRVILQTLLNRGKQLITKGQQALLKFRQERNYFSSSLEKELLALIKLVEHLQKESENVDSDNPFFKEFLYQAEIEVAHHSQRLSELIQLGEKGTDAAYVQLLHLIDALVTRAYADIGFLYMHEQTELAGNLKAEIIQIQDLEKQLKSVDFNLTPNLAEKCVSLLDFDLGSLIPEDYNPQVRPLSPYGLNSTTNVSLSLYLNELVNVDDANQEMEVDLIIVQEWYDTRLNLDRIDGQIAISEQSKLNMFWLPDLYIINALRARIVDSFEPAQKLIINQQGLMHYAIRVLANIKCSLNLQLYPMDTQYCHIRFSSLLYNREQMSITFKIFDVHKGEYPHFKIRLWYAYEICRPWHNPIKSNDCIVATVKLVRHLGYYIIRYYLVTFLEVVITFVGFWIPINGWPARVTVMLIPLLDLITEDIDINNDIEVNYVTAFHWWMMWIQGIVYLVVVEYAVAIAWAHFIVDKKNHRKLLQEAQANPEANIQVPPVLLGYYCGNNGWYARAGRFVDRMLYFFFGEVDLQREPYVRNKIDYTSRILFPLIFILFVVIYILATVAPWAANYN